MFISMENDQRGYVPMHERCGHSPLYGRVTSYLVDVACNHYKPNEEALLMKCGTCANNPDMK